jgi:alkyl sulfatase BDS1-like metallo-beta-lactamase superfamily hydrolase
MAAEMATKMAADSTTSARTEEAQPLYVAADHMDVDPFDDGYLLERLIDSVRLTDNNTQWMIASVRFMLDGWESPTDLQRKAPKVQNRGERNRRLQGRRPSHWLKRSLWHGSGRSDSTRPKQRFGL